MDGDEVHEDGRGEAVVGGDAEPVLELETKVHPKVCNHGEGPFIFKSLLRHYAKQTLTPQ